MIFFQYIIYFLLLKSTDSFFFKKNFFHKKEDFKITTPVQPLFNKWYVIAQSDEIHPNIPYPIKILNKELVIWRSNHSLNVLDNFCLHRGASLSNGCIKRHNIICPYHNIELNGQGQIMSIPSNDENASQQTLPNLRQISYQVKEKHNWIYLLVNNTYSTIDNMIDEDEMSMNFNCQYFHRKIRQNYKLVCENLLDILHISYVHSFGNKQKPLPITQSVPIKIQNNTFHWKIKYIYNAGMTSLVNFLTDKKFIIVESEFILPNKIVSRVIFGKYVKTIVSSALPVDLYNTKLFVKIYRNYWVSHIKLIDKIADQFMGSFFSQTITEDSNILEDLDYNRKNTLHFPCDAFPLLYRRKLTEYQDDFVQ